MRVEVDAACRAGVSEVRRAGQQVFVDVEGLDRASRISRQDPASWRQVLCRSLWTLM